MELASSRPQLTSLLDNDVLGRIERLRLNPRQRKTNRSRGEHLAGKGGTSTEFSDYRDYVAGDDIRFVDWNVFARLHRPYMKLYQYEEELQVVLLVDGSSSMRFEGKFERACQLAAAFGVMGLLNSERVSVYGCQDADAPPQVLPPVTGRANMMRMFAFLEGLECGGDVAIEQAVQSVLTRHRGRGIAIVLSDFLTDANLTKPLNLLFSAGLVVFAMQILGPSELDPELTGDLRLIDCETGGTLDVSSIGELLGIYRDHLETLEHNLLRYCLQRNGRFMTVASDAPIEWVLFDRLLRQGGVQ